MRNIKRKCVQEASTPNKQQLDIKTSFSMWANKVHTSKQLCSSPNIIVKRPLPFDYPDDDEEVLPINDAKKSKINIISNQIVTPPKPAQTSKTECLSQTTKQLNSTPRQPKEEKPGINKYFLKSIKDLIDSIFESKYLIDLLTENEMTLLNNLRNAKQEYQYVCFKLYKWQPKWHKLSEYLDRINLMVQDKELIALFDFLKGNNFVETDYKNDEIETLLNVLVKKDISSICQKFKISTSLSTKLGSLKKADLIQKILKTCKNQQTLTKSMSASDLVRIEISKKLGLYAIKVKDEFKKWFRRVFILATFTNSHLSTLDDFLNFMQRGNELPDFVVTDYPVFYSPAEFDRYEEACAFKDLDLCQKNPLTFLAWGNTIFKNLKSLPQIEDENRYNDTPHLKRFTAESMYKKCLTGISEKISTKYCNEVKEWLEYLKEKYPKSQQLGKWYFLLVRINHNLRNSEIAGDLLVEAFERREEFSDVDVEILQERARFMFNKNITQYQKDVLLKLMPERLREDAFPRITVDSVSIRSNAPGRKRDYVYTDAKGNKEYKTVEEVALDYYCKEVGYTNGLHCENSIILALFALFFWDIIYHPQKEVPGTFVSKLQCYPLDFYTIYFYKNRKEIIDYRLKNVAANWSDAKLWDFVSDKWDSYGHVTCFCKIKSIISSKDILKVLIACMERNVMAKIFERLVKNIKLYGSGLPDLFLWDVKNSKCKFVEVKGEGDTLSEKQKLWLQYLQSIGADIEVCFVHSIGSKKKSGKGKLVKPQKASNKTKKSEKSSKNDTSVVVPKVVTNEKHLRISIPKNLMIDYDNDSGSDSSSCFQPKTPVSPKKRKIVLNMKNNSNKNNSKICTPIKNGDKQSTNNMNVSCHGNSLTSNHSKSNEEFSKDKPKRGGWLSKSKDLPKKNSKTDSEESSKSFLSSSDSTTSENKREHSESNENAFPSKKKPSRRLFSL
ncbi:unnamed protein product [Phyllotreta striolata]|uniref:Fanconi-associated nuclease n=1 Tax=Phyllotreta striolata TaxID=444603 RepID=A0A9N9THZ3_PHYSR|nr:unnamed protein product [Phyllotreta striolata]